MNQNKKLLNPKKYKYIFMRSCSPICLDLWVVMKYKTCNILVQSSILLNLLKLQRGKDLKSSKLGKLKLKKWVCTLKIPKTSYNLNIKTYNNDYTTYHLTPVTYCPLTIHIFFFFFSVKYYQVATLVRREFLEICCYFRYTERLSILKIKIHNY